MDDKEILDRIEAIATRIEGSVTKIADRLTRVEVRFDTNDKALGFMQKRQSKMEAEQVATKIRIAYVAGGAAVGTALASYLLDLGVMAAKAVIGGG